MSRLSTSKRRSKHCEGIRFQGHNCNYSNGLAGAGAVKRNHIVSVHNTCSVSTILMSELAQMQLV